MSDINAECSGCHEVKFCPYRPGEEKNICCECMDKVITEQMDSYELEVKRHKEWRESPEWRRKIGEILQAMQSFTAWLKKKKPGVIEEDGKK